MTMQSLFSDQLEDFAAVYEKDIELVSVQRSTSETLLRMSETLFAERAVLGHQWSQKAGSSQDTIDTLAPLIEPGPLAELAGEIAEASDLLGELLGCKEVGLRVSTLHKPMCPRFHVDHVVTRMLITVRGPGTEWIPHASVDTEAFEDRSFSGAPLKSGAKVEHLAEGHWTLLKGGAWSDAYPGVVHRSPHDEGARLLVSLDPLL